MTSSRLDQDGPVTDVFESGHSAIAPQRSRPHHRRAMSAAEDPGTKLAPTEWRDLRRLAAFMVPTSAEYGVPSADDTGK